MNLFTSSDTGDLSSLLLLLLSVSAGLAFALRTVRPPISSIHSQKAFYSLMLFGIFVFSFWIRASEIDFGLPQFYNPDELRKVQLLQKLRVSEDFAPEQSLHPPLLLYTTYALFQLQEVFPLPFSNLETPFKFLLSGRLLSSILGSLSVLLVYFLARTLHSAPVGLLSAAFYGFAPLPATCSRYLKEDTILCFFLLLCVLCLVLAGKRKSNKLFYLSAVCGGLALGSKYTALLIVPLFFLYPLLFKDNYQLTRKEFFVSTIGSIIFGLSFLLVLSPALYKLWSFYGGFLHEARHALGGHHGISISPWEHYWSFHLSRSIIPGLSLSTFILAGVGIGLAAASKQRLSYLPIFLFLLFLLPAEYAPSKPMPQPDRYILPALPWLCILAAVAANRLVQSLPATALKLLACVVLVAFPLSRTLELKAEVRNDTRTLMTSWMKTNLPAGKKVIYAGSTSYLPRIPKSLHQKSLRNVLGREKQDLPKKLQESGYDYLLISRMADERFKRETEGPQAQVWAEIDTNLPVAARFTSNAGSYGFHNPQVTLYELRR